MVQHSIRPEFERRLPPAVPRGCSPRPKDQTLDPQQFVAFAPDDAWVDFSFASERVSHDAAITSLVACERALRASPSSIFLGRAPASCNG